MGVKKVKKRKPAFWEEKRISDTEPDTNKGKMPVDFSSFYITPENVPGSQINLYTLLQMFDNDPATYYQWGTAYNNGVTVNGQIVMDLNQMFPIKQVILHYDFLTENTSTFNFYFEYSSNGSDWVQIANQTYTGAANQTRPNLQAALGGFYAKYFRFRYQTDPGVNIKLTMLLRELKISI